jgi:cohesin loading factor subunit SCC2
MALQMLMREGEKRPDSLRQRVCLGVKKAYQFQKEVYHSKANVSALVPATNGQGSECIFDSIFKDCIASIRKQRHGLFKNLLGLFELGGLQEESRSNKKKDRSVDLALLSFVAQILAHLSYNTADNPLYIIYHITSMVTLQGEQILERLADVLRTVGLSSDDRLDDSNACEDALERAANARFPSRTQEAQALNSPSFDLEEFTYLCRAGAAMALLLRLKLYLCRVYNLNETKCIEYNPTQKERPTDKGLTKVEVSKQFNCAVAPGLLHDRVDKDALIRQVRCFVIVVDYNIRRHIILIHSLIHSRMTPFLQRQYAEFRLLSRDDMNITTKQEEEEDAMDEQKKEENEEEEEELPEEPMPEAKSAPEPLSGKKRSRRSSGRG